MEVWSKHLAISQQKLHLEQCTFVLNFNLNFLSMAMRNMALVDLSLGLKVEAFAKLVEEITVRSREIAKAERKKINAKKIGGCKEHIWSKRGCS